MINVAELILDPEFNQKITLKIADKFENNFETKKIDSVVLPVTPQDLQLLPEGERLTPSVKVYSIEQTKCGDRFTYKDEEYRILIANNWSDYGIYNAIATKFAGTEKGYNDGFIIT